MSRKASTPKRAEAYPHEKAVQKRAYVVLAVAIVLAAVPLLMRDARSILFGIPLAILFLALIAGAILGVFAIHRRVLLLAIGSVTLTTLAIIPAGHSAPSLLELGLGILYGLASLALLELVHMTERYERAHEAVDKENVPEEHVNRVTDEAVRTLAVRGGISALAVILVMGLANLLQVAGPRQWRAAVETSAPTGIAVIALALAGASGLVILARSARLPRRREKEEKEVLPDVAD